MSDIGLSGPSSPDFMDGPGFMKEAWELYDLAKAARNLRRARSRLDAAMAVAEQATVAAHKNGMAETRIATKLGVNRMTVRRWLGKL